VAWVGVPVVSRPAGKGPKAPGRGLFLRTGADKWTKQRKKWAIFSCRYTWQPPAGWV